MDYEPSESSECETEQDETFNPNLTKRPNSFVWKYFRAVADTNTYECILCHTGKLGSQTSNLARHLATSHNIRKGINNDGRGRPSRSFIWKYCTKEDQTHARCHFCQKLLFFGGGNTSNVAKHLRRKHQDLIENKQETMDEATETLESNATINLSSNGNLIIDTTPTESDRRERKGGSYVWKYCDKVSRDTIRCNLCSKLMSFHGTANVITHLQRRHYIIGKVEEDNCNLRQTQNLSEVNVNADELDEVESNAKQAKRSTASSSIVWNYCTRISKDVVQCGFCNKNLSYQGTSNLQRHLHRMHGIVMPARTSINNGETQSKPLDNNFIWKHFELDGDKAKCKMCAASFDSNDTTVIIKHLTVTHAVDTKHSPKAKRRKGLLQNETIYQDTSDDEENDNWTKRDELKTDVELEDFKKDDSNHGFIDKDEPVDYDEDPFDPSLLKEVPLVNPLSPQTSVDCSMYNEQKYVVYSKEFQKLNEERVRMETEYFREKAGYYRMQKYLTALHAKKMRLEIERISKCEFNASDMITDQVPAS